MWRVHELIIDTFTVNISSGGFYCLSCQPFSPGETLIAVLEIPGPGADGESERLVLRCEVLVLRVQALIDSANCGVACRTINYSVLRAAGMTSSSAQSSD